MIPLRHLPITAAILLALSAGPIPAADPRDAMVFDAATGRVHALSFAPDGAPRLETLATLNLGMDLDMGAEQVRAWGPGAVAASTMVGMPEELGARDPFTHMDRILRRDDATGVWRADLLDLSFDGVPDDSRESFDRIFSRLPTAESLPPADCCPLWFPVADERFTEVVRLMNAGDRGAADNLLGELVAAHPDSFLFHLLAIDLAIMQGRDDVARGRIAAFRDLAGRRGRAIMAQALKEHELWLRGMDAANSGRNSRHKLRVLLDSPEGRPPSSQAEIDSALASMLPGDLHIPTDEPLFLATDQTPNLRDIQVAAKVARVRADAALFHGRPDEALSVLEGCQRAGASMTLSGTTLIDHVIGIAVSMMVSRGYEHVFLNAWDSPTELEDSWPRLTEARDAFAADPEATPPCLEVSGKPSGPNYVELETRRRVAIVRWTLLRTATAARHRLMDRGDFPRSAAEFAPLLSGGPDFDAFTAEGAPLRWLPEVDGVWTAYSLGPDRMDQRAAIEYDPTNGSLSAGDITVRVHRSRQYRFPVQGEKPPRTNAEFRARYGESLPPDPFADTKRLSYTVGDGEKLRVFSFGPDTDERDMIAWNNARNGEPLGSLPAALGYAVLPGGGVRRILPAAMQQPAYDPTNGTLSAGNITLWGE